MSTWSQLEQLLTCAICLDRFRNPKLLPCQHTFCGEPCMEGLVDYARRQIKCPECRAEHRIPYNGVQSFPNNVTLTRFLDLHRGITGEEPEPLPSQMDRCGVCGEKSVCLRCSHCEKKVCDECRVAHLDILRREINRINIQVRRGLTKLTEHAQQASKNSEKLIVTSTQIRDEITESVRRLIKDLKDKEAKLLADLDEFTESETKNGEKLKDDLEMELQTLTSNCELVDEHVTEDDEWTDAELMEYKDIFTKTLDFLRNLDDDTINLSRKIKYIQKVDLENIRRTVADFGEVKITPATGTLSMASNANLSPSESSANLSIPQSTLMRSQSDHRLAAQFASRSQRADPLQRSYLDVSGQGRYGSGIGSDTERERGSSPPGRRGERFGSVRSYEDRNRSEFSYTRGWQRPGDTEYEPSNSSNFRSRFMRERIRERGGASGDDHSFEDPHDSDVGSGGPRVRFQEEDASSKKPKLFDNEEMTNMRAPLSGILKLVDSPQIMERLHQNGVKAKLKEAEEKANAAPTPTPYVPPSNPAPRPARQISEDEIEKQKKQNKMAAAQQSTPTASSPAATPVAPSQPLSPKVTPTKPSSLAVEQTASPRSTISPSPVVTNRRIVALQKEETRSNRSSSEDNTNSGAESADQDDDLSPTSAISSTTRRRIFASSHPASSGSASISNNDYGTESSRTTASKQPQPTTNSYYQSPYYGHTQRNSTSNSRYGIEDSSTGAAASTPTVPTYFSSVKSRRISRDEDASSIVADTPATPSANSTTSSYYSQYGRRSSVGRGSTLDDDVADSDNHADIAPRSVASSAYSSGRKPTNAQSSSERYSSSGSSYLRNRLAKSRSSHAIACEDSDDESSTTTNNNANPISPTTTSFRSRFGFGSNTTPDQAPAERPTPTRRTSRSGYQYRTRDQSPEDDSGAGSVTQYLIKKYGSHGSHTSANRPSMLSKSKSSHVIYGRSLSSSDEEVQAPIQASPYRRSSRDSETLTSPSYKSANSFGLTYPRQIYLQKRKMMMKIGSRGTNPSCFTWPRGVACAPDNSIVVADSSNHRVQVFDSTGRFQFEFGSYGSGEGEFDCLAGVTVNRIGHFVVSDRYNHRVQVFDASGRFLRAFGSEGRSDGKFSYPWGIATDALGFIYVCDKENHRIQVFQSDGTFVGKFGSIGSRSGMLEHPHYIAISNTNRIVVSDSNNHRVQVFDINGRSISTFGTEGSGEGQFKFPRGVAVDENGFIIVGDSGNNRIQIFNPDGSFLKSFGSWGSGESEFKGLEGVSISSTGNILVCDRENHRIQIF